jgi:hypothetical protein
MFKKFVIVSCLGGVMVSVLANESKIRGFKPI